jgi:pimeloyl-ACP methyl ester carboxylesterase
MGGTLALLASIELAGNVRNVVAFNPYDYPSGMERGNWFARVIGTGGRRRGYPTVNRAIMRSRTGFIDATERYPQVTAPVTLVCSERDWSRPADRERMARQLGVRAITVASAGHFSALERPAEMVGIIGRSPAS